MASTIGLLSLVRNIQIILQTIISVKIKTKIQYQFSRYVLRACSLFSNLGAIHHFSFLQADEEKHSSSAGHQACFAACMKDAKLTCIFKLQTKFYFYSFKTASLIFDHN